MKKAITLGTTLIFILCVGCANSEISNSVYESQNTDNLQSESANLEPTTSEHTDSINCDENGFEILPINVPVHIDDPETSFHDFFASLGITEWSLTSYDKEVIYGDDVVAFVSYDLGNDAIFMATIFQNMNGSWDVERWYFHNPNAQIVYSLIEKAIEDILAYERSSECEWNKSAFRSNTILGLMFGDVALEYVFYCFENGKGQGDRGMILAELGSHILGSRDNVPSGWRTGEEWFSQLEPLEIVALPPFDIGALGFPKYEEMAAKSIIDELSRFHSNMLAVTHIHHVKEEDDMLTLWVTGWFSSYSLYEKKLVMTTGGEIRARIEYKKDAENQYVVVNFIQSQDGGSYLSSIEAFCLPIPGLFEEMIDYNFTDLKPKMIDALQRHFETVGLVGIYLYDEAWGLRTQLT